MQVIDCYVSAYPHTIGPITAPCMSSLCWPPGNAEREYIMLSKWLPGTEDKLPANPSHQVLSLLYLVRFSFSFNSSAEGWFMMGAMRLAIQVGVGAFIFDRHTNKVLMVQEKNGPLKGGQLCAMMSCAEPL